MFQTILHVTGLDRQLETLKFEIEGKANHAISHVKAAALQIAVVAAFAVAAVVFAALAILAGFVSLFVWLQPLYGTLPAIGIVAGALVLIAVMFVAIAVVVGKRRPEPMNLSAPAGTNLSHEQVAETRKVGSPGGAAATDLASDKSEPASATSSSEILDSALAVVRHFAKSPKTGIEPIDNIIRAVEPRAEEATREAVHRAATLVQTGDRKTMIAILGTTAALGWLIVKFGSHAGKLIVIDGNVSKSP